MADTYESKRSTKKMLLLTLWAFVPAILISTSIAFGLDSDYMHPQPLEYYSNPSSIGGAILAVGVYGMPFMLIFWSIYVLKGDRERLTSGILIGSIPLTFMMCVVNIILGATGCGILSEVIPQEGIF